MKQRGWLWLGVVVAWGMGAVQPRVAWACPDADGDGYADSDCGGTDCNDAVAAISPGAEEVCDGRDNDCDGLRDENDAVGAVRWFLDADGDGFGSPAHAAQACDAPADHVDNDADCDDTRPGVHPEATERCNGLDDDCSGTIDDAPVDLGLFYADIDGDGYGDIDAPIEACAAPPGFVSNATDCDDADGSVWTSAPGLSSSCPTEDAAGEDPESSSDKGGGCHTTPTSSPRTWPGLGLGLVLLASLGRRRRV